MTFRQSYYLRSTIVPATDASRLNLFSYDTITLLGIHIAAIIIVLLWMRNRASLSVTMAS